jgi:hypothetical protein
MYSGKIAVPPGGGGIVLMIEVLVVALKFTRVGNLREILCIIYYYYNISKINLKTELIFNNRHLNTINNTVAYDGKTSSFSMKSFRLLGQF